MILLSATYTDWLSFHQLPNYLEKFKNLQGCLYLKTVSSKRYSFIVYNQITIITKLSSYPICTIASNLAVSFLNCFYHHCLKNFIILTFYLIILYRKSIQKSLEGNSEMFVLILQKFYIQRLNNHIKWKTANS